MTEIQIILAVQTIISNIRGVRCVARYYKSTKKFNPEQKTDILYRFIRAGSRSILNDETKFNMDFEWFPPYVDIVVEISAKHGLTKQYTKAILAIKNSWT